MKKFYKIKDICKVKGGKRIPAGETLQVEKNSYPYIRILDMYQGRIIKNDESLLYAKEKYINKIKNYTVKTNDVILAIVGNTLGLVSTIDKSLNGAILTENCCKFDNLDETKVIKLFLYYSLIMPINVSAIQKFKVGSSQPKLPLYNVDQLLVPTYSILEQEKIVDILSALDSKIELNNKINDELEAMAKTLYDYWFVQFDFPDENGKPYKSSGGKMVYNEALKREIPEGWKVISLFEEMNVQYGFPFDTSKFTDQITDKPIVRIRDILENSISAYTTESPDGKYKLNANDLIIGMDGNFHMNFWDKEGAYLNQRSVRIRSKENSEVSNFQAYFELSPYIKAREGNVSRTTVGHLSDKDLKRLFVMLPIKTNNFNPKKYFDTLLNQIIINRLQNQKLVELRDWLLPMLMNGQVTFKENADSEQLVEEYAQLISEISKDEKVSALKD